MGWGQDGWEGEEVGKGYPKGITWAPPNWRAKLSREKNLSMVKN